MTLRTATCLTLALAAGCAKPQPALYASPAEQPAYAERYPSALGGARIAYAADEQQAQALTAGFVKYPDALDKPHWPLVIEVVKTADEAGKTGDYASGMGQAEAVRAFYTGAKDPMHRKVAGSVDYVAKQKQCEVDLGGTAAAAMDRALDQELDDSVRSHNPAIRLIEDNQDAFGTANADKLSKQADQIALASYVVHVRMPQTKRTLDAALADSGSIKQTLERDQERANQILTDTGTTRAAKALAEKHKTAATSALASLDTEVSEAKKLSAEMDKRADAAQKDYAKALDALLDALDARAKAAPQKK